MCVWPRNRCLHTKKGYYHSAPRRTRLDPVQYFTGRVAPPPKVGFPWGALFSEDGLVGGAAFWRSDLSRTSFIATDLISSVSHVLQFSPTQIRKPKHQPHTANHFLRVRVQFNYCRDDYRALSRLNSNFFFLTGWRGITLNDKGLETFEKLLQRSRICFFVYFLRRLLNKNCNNFEG